MIGTRRERSDVAMLRVLLIRTGATEYDCQGRIQGTLDVPLSEDGRQQVERAAEQLSEAANSVKALYSGPGRSAQQTADILGEKLGLKSKTLEKLRNLDQGLWQGMLVQEVKSKQPKVYRQWSERPDTVCPPQGETLNSARERLQDVLAKLARKHKTGDIALVLPDPLASVLRSILRDDDVSRLWDVKSLDKPLWEPIALLPASG
ncbi:MAG: histidine phosphatase family protein [Planctomycetota bacterium]